MFYTKKISYICIVVKLKTNKMKHKTTMSPEQRVELIRVLGQTHDLKDLAIKTDSELHEQWLIDCEYENIYK